MLNHIFAPKRVMLSASALCARLQSSLHTHAAVGLIVTWTLSLRDVICLQRKQFPVPLHFPFGLMP